MKQPLAWHKVCLKNSLSSLNDKKSRLARIIADVERHERECRFYNSQIEEAERLGLDGFDPDRFMTNKKVK